MKWKVVAIALLVATLSGCAFWDGFRRGITGQSPVEAPTILDAAGQTTGYAIVDTAVFFPSPWREVLIALISGVTGWAAATRKEEVE